MAKIMKIFTILLSISLLFYNVSFALTEEELSLLKPADTTNKELVLTAATIGVPKDFGTIKDRFVGKDNRLIIHIQDAHCNYEAQTNIANILESLYKEYKVDFVSLEGADGVIDTAWFKAFPDAEIRKEVADYFMKKGEITGAEFISITTDYPITLYGAENRDLYIKNLNAFTSSYPVKDEIEKYFIGIKAVLNKLKNYVYSKTLREIDARMNDYKEKRLSLSDYARFLNSLVEKHKLPLHDYPNFGKLVYTLQYEDKIDFKTVDQERSLLIDTLSKKLAKDQLSDLVLQSFSFKSGKISSAQYYDYLKNTAEQNGIVLQEGYPNLHYYCIYTRLYDKIENELLFKEIDELKERIKKIYFVNDDQETLNRLSLDIGILIDLVNVRLSNIDYEYYKAHKKDFDPNKFLGFMHKEVLKYNLSYDLEDAYTLVLENMPKLEEFYEMALVRDRAIVDNTLEGMEEGKRRISVLITGGFHTQGVVNLLKEKGVSYVVVTPSITKEAESPYIQVLTGQRMSFEEIMFEESPKAVEDRGMLVPHLVSRAVGMNEEELNEFGPDIVKRAGAVKADYVRIGYDRWVERARSISGAIGFHDVDDTTFRRAYDIALTQGINRVVKDKARAKIIFADYAKQLALSMPTEEKDLTLLARVLQNENIISEITLLRKGEGISVSNTESIKGIVSVARAVMEKYPQAGAPSIPQIFRIALLLERSPTGDISRESLEAIEKLPVPEISRPFKAQVLEAARIVLPPAADVPGVAGVSIASPITGAEYVNVFVNNVREALEKYPMTEADRFRLVFNVAALFERAPSREALQEALRVATEMRMPEIPEENRVFQQQLFNAIAQNIAIDKVAELERGIGLLRPDLAKRIKGITPENRLAIRNWIGEEIKAWNRQEAPNKTLHLGQAHIENIFRYLSLRSRIEMERPFSILNPGFLNIPVGFGMVQFSSGPGTEVFDVVRFARPAAGEEAEVVMVPALEVELEGMLSSLFGLQAAAERAALAPQVRGAQTAELSAEESTLDIILRARELKALLGDLLDKPAVIFHHTSMIIPKPVKDIVETQLNAAFRPWTFPQDIVQTAGALAAEGIPFTIIYTEENIPEFERALRENPEFLNIFTNRDYARFLATEPLNFLDGKIVRAEMGTSWTHPFVLELSVIARALAVLKPEEATEDNALCSQIRGIMGAFRGQLPGIGQFSPSFPITGASASVIINNLHFLLNNLIVSLPAAARIDEETMERIRAERIVQWAL